MTAQGEDILAWLESAISVTEQAAHRAAEAAESAAWEEYGGDVYGAGPGGNPLAAGVMYGDMFETMSLPVVLHMVLHDPESVLRRCAADRKLLELHQGVPNHGRYSEPECPADCDGQHDGPPVCVSCRDYAGDPLEAPCATVLVVAEGYGWTGGER